MGTPGDRCVEQAYTALRSLIRPLQQVGLGDGAVDGDDCILDGAGLSGLNCAGFGSSMAVTASFGLVAVAYLMDRLAKMENEHQRG